MTPKEFYEFVGWRVRLEFKLQDLWIGAYWRQSGNSVDLYVCLLPCLPIHIWWGWHDTRQ